MGVRLLSWAVIAICATSRPLAASPKPPPVAVFEFEMIDTSLEGSVNGPRHDEQARVKSISDRLQRELTRSGEVQVIDTEAVRSKARSFHLQQCGGCDADFARQIGARLSITGTVQKVSNLILNMSLYIRDADSGRLLDAMNADMRGNTDESWTRTLDWLVQNRLVPALQRIPR